MRPPVLRKSCLVIILAAVLFAASFLPRPFSVTSHAEDSCGVGVLILSFHFLDNDYSVMTVTLDCGIGGVCSATAVICSCGTVDFQTDCFE